MERPDNPDGGPGLPQNGDGFEKGLCTCFFSHLSTHGRKVSFLNIGGWSQVTPTGDSIRDLCLPEPWICLLMRMSPAPASSSWAKRKTVASPAMARKTWSKAGFRLGAKCLLHRTGICCHSVEGGFESDRAGWQVRSAALWDCHLCPMYSAPLTLNIFLLRFLSLSPYLGTLLSLVPRMKPRVS